MEIVNTTPFVVACTLGTDKTGLDHLLAIAKATFKLTPNGAVEMAEEPHELVAADEPSGEPGYSATLRESDFALVKPRCDVLLTGSAYAPGGRPASEVVVSLRVAGMQKSLRVTGHRSWRTNVLGGIEAGSPEPFASIAFSYDSAFGGIDDFHEDPSEHTSYRDNPVGSGYHKKMGKNLVAGTPMPNTEELGRPVKVPDGKYRPMALGPVGRGWPQRLKYAGTYDTQWQENQFPFLPKDFDNRYFQAAPADQQIDSLNGGERVVLQNLTESGYCAFRLPRMAIESVVFYLRTGEYLIAPFKVDTLHFFPDEGVYTMVARASVPFSEDPQACSKVIFGRGSKGWVRALESGKRYVSLERKVLGSRRYQELTEPEEQE